MGQLCLSLGPMPRRYPAKAGTCMICSTRDNGYAFLHLPEDIHLTYDIILCHYFHKPTQRRYEILLNILDFTRKDIYPTYRRIVLE
jgi:hypothetical protein